MRKRYTTSNGFNDMIRVFSAFVMFAMAFSEVAGQSEEQAIRDKITTFSNLLMEDRREEVVAMYTDDARIFPAGRDILGGSDLAEYWNPKDLNSKIIYHKVTPEEIKIIGEEAYDWGYYEGTSESERGQSNWRGKYIIIWKKIGDDWKIYLDIWNRVD